MIPCMAGIRAGKLDLKKKEATRSRPSLYHIIRFLLEISQSSSSLIISRHHTLTLLSLTTHNNITFSTTQTLIIISSQKHNKKPAHKTCSLEINHHISIPGSNFRQHQFSPTSHLSVLKILCKCRLLRIQMGTIKLHS